MLRKATSPLCGTRWLFLWVGSSVKSHLNGSFYGDQLIQVVAFKVVYMVESRAVT
ncbi:hypothetical protein C7460_1174 [Marinoscillum furvescens DSM 4134]|uniref:Uncharacterized protein n=1 Tax=Marinoscillum furvescens DSM 4134 TaxID=1122208 RepID=A0A3D9L109_MARFU|nr:hypothetical protein C7460_1174 [Marinoscillum furvescens DSM 4134]